MKIFIANESKQRVGGGWSFLANFAKYINKTEHSIVALDVPKKTQDNDKTYEPRLEEFKTKLTEQADIIFIPSASMITEKVFTKLKESGKPIVLRVDNALKASRNKRGMSRLLRYADECDAILFQSLWAREYLTPWLRRNMVEKKKLDNAEIIYNGGDTDVFFPPKGNRPHFAYRYLFIKEKRFEEAAYHFYKKALADPECILTIVGRMPQELIDANFDFFNAENVKYMGEVSDRGTIATLMRNNDVLLFPAFADACPQTIVEARLCGLEVELVNPIGGTQELMNLPVEMLTLDRMGDEYIKEFQKLL